MFISQSVPNTLLFFHIKKKIKIKTIVSEITQYRKAVVNTSIFIHINVLIKANVTNTIKIIINAFQQKHFCIVVGY